MPDGPVPDDVFDACVKVLAAWDWPARPVGVVTIASRRRPQLVTSLGERIATIGRLRLRIAACSNTTTDALTRNQPA